MFVWLYTQEDDFFSITFHKEITEYSKSQMNKKNQNWLYSVLFFLVLTKDGIGIQGPVEIKINTLKSILV